MKRFGMICAAALLSLGMVCCGQSACFAQDADDEDAVEVEMIEMDEMDVDEDAPEPSDDFVVPEKGTPDEYRAFIETVMKTPPKTQPASEEDFVKMLTARFGVCAQAAEKIMADPSATDQQYMEAVEIRLTMASIAARQSEDTKAILAAVESMLAEAKKAKREAAVAQLTMMVQMVKLQAAASEGKEAVQKELTALMAIMDAKEKLEAQDLQMIMSAARLAENMVDEAMALEIYKKYTEKAKAAMPEAGRAFEQAVRRLGLLGNEMQIAGKSLEGKDVDVKNLKGKVVLIDFWATWCGPCVGEVPNMLEMYKKYHEQGFEIIGISLDDKDDLDGLKAFLKQRKIKWDILLDADTDLEGETLSDFYGVQGIPAMYLIGKDGKVISMNARGEKLKELLEVQFPEK